MNPTTLSALKESVKKWERIRDGKETDLGSTNCALCQAFIIDDCDGCPVISGCNNTEYKEWESYFGLGSKEVFDSTSLALATAELDYLRSLLPGDEA